MNLFRFTYLCLAMLLTAPIFGQANLTAVWPGDADNNGIVNNLDFLQLGLAYNKFGPPRDSAQMGWSPQVVQFWSSSANGINAVYADADGGGLVHFQSDGLPILMNYNRRRGVPININYPVGVPGIDPPLFLDDSGVNPTMQGGQSVSLPIVLGTADLPVEDMYGFAFSLHSDPKFIDNAQAKFNFNELSWANNDNDRFFAVKRVSNSRLDVAWCRDDHNHRSGHGRIGSFDFIIIDNIVGLQENTSLVIDSIYAIDRHGNEFALAGDTLTFMVDPDDSTSAEHQPISNLNVDIFPNPSEGAVFVSSTSSIETIEVFDQFGRRQHQEFPNAKSKNIDLAYLPKGIYSLRMQTEEGTLIRQLILF